MVEEETTKRRREKNVSKLVSFFPFKCPARSGRRKSAYSTNAGIEEGLEDFCLGYRKNKNVKRQERIEWEYIDIVIAR